MDKEFESWVNEFDESFRESKSYNTIVGTKGYNEPSMQLMGWYIQFKQHQSHERLVSWTKWLVFGTWILAIGTIILSILTLIK